MENTYLEHHGVKGMRWGVRRYQNPDGSLTAAGRKRATKNRVKAINARTKAKLKKLREDEKNKVKIERAKAKTDAKIEKAKSKLDDKLDDAKKNPTLLDRVKGKKNTDDKSIKDMSNEEIQTKIDRIRLEQQLASLTPQTKSKGKAFVDSLMKDVVAPTAKKVGQQWLEKKIKEALGLDDKDAKSIIDEMKKFNEEYKITKTYEQNKAEIHNKAQKAEEAKRAAEQAKKDAKAQKKAERKEAREERAEQREKQKEEKTRQKEAEKRFEEVRNKAKEKESSNKEQETERYEFTGDDVIGKGTSRYNERKNDGPIYDGDYRETKVSDTTTGVTVTTGRDYVNQFLLEDKWK